MDISVLQKIEEADMVLIGLGEEFDCIKHLKQNEEYKEMSQVLEAESKKWLLPLLNQQYLQNEEQNHVTQALEKLAMILRDKNYFVVSTSTNPLVANIPWKENRFVAPCGSYNMKQCSCGCENTLQETTNEDIVKVEDYFDRCGQSETSDCLIGSCVKCGKPKVFNNIYAPEYDENGYIKQWEMYTKWLQGTLNKKLVVLELGVNMQFPSVIRFPFEKVTFFNQKAFMYRVNEKLYFLSEELSGKGLPISENAVEWLLKE